LSRTNLFTLSTSEDLALGKIYCLVYMYISVVSQLRKIRGVGDYTQLTVHTVLNRTVGIDIISVIYQSSLHRK